SHTTEDVADETPTDLLPALEPGVPIDGPGTVEQELLGVNIQVAVPEGWSVRLDPSGENLNLFNSPADADVQYGSAPTIGFLLDKQNFFDIPDDAAVIDNRTIGGIDMEGHTMEYSGGITSYIGQAENTTWIHVYSRGFDISDGEGKAIVDSIKFAVK
ncbi:MAG: hypothetical protein FWE87_06400, partial [Coriobacteriia bacterium]|nr:hypothetical protein [Coriobacteriia bacterium]